MTDLEIAKANLVSLEAQKVSLLAQQSIQLDGAQKRIDAAKGKIAILETPKPTNVKA